MAALILFLILAISVMTDLSRRIIPNRTILTGLVLALAFQMIEPQGHGPLSVQGGSVGVSAMSAGIAVGLATLLPLYVLRAIGAGDVKLMMVVGAFLGPMQTFGVVVLTFAAGGVLALGIALWQRSFQQLAANLRFMLTTSAIRAAGGESPRFEPLAQTAGRMPYAVAIAAGTLLQLILVRSGGWALS